MKKTIRIGYVAYHDAEVEVGEEFEEFVQQMEDAEARDDEDAFDDLCCSKQMDELIEKFRWAYDDIVNMRLSTDEESLIYDN